MFVYSITNMPLTKVSHDWFIRITQPHEFIKNQLGDIKVWPSVTRVLVVSHIGEKTKKEHVHMLLSLNKELQQQSVNVIFKKLFTEARCISVKIWDGKTEGQSALSYLWHDTRAEILFNKGFTDTEIETSRLVCQGVVEEVNKRKQRAPGHCVSRILDEITSSNHTWNEEQICYRILQMVREGEIYEPGDFLIQRYVNEINSKQAQSPRRWASWAEGRVMRILKKDYLELEHNNGNNSST